MVYANCINNGIFTHIETTGLIPKISVLFSLYGAISLILGINCLIFGEVALFSLPVLEEGNLSKARTSNKKHEYTLTLIFWPSAMMLVVFFYALKYFSIYLSS